MPEIQDWHRLMALVGIHGPLTQTIDNVGLQDSAFTRLPADLSNVIYEELLGGLWEPTIVRTASGHLCIHMRRAAAYSKLLLLRKQVYKEAVLLFFSAKAFRVAMQDEVRNVDLRRRIPHDAMGETALGMPRRLNMSFVLEPTSGLVVQLTRLQQVLAVRKDNPFVTTVSLSFFKLPTAQKMAVVRSLKAFFPGHNALIRLLGIGDVLDDEDQDVYQLALLMEKLKCKDEFTSKPIDPIDMRRKQRMAEERQ